MAVHAEMFLDHGSLRLLVLTLLQERPSRHDEVIASLAPVIARAQGGAPSLDRVIEMLERLGYVNADGNPAILAPTDDGIALLAAGREQADRLIEVLTGTQHDRPVVRSRRCVRPLFGWARA